MVETTILSILPYIWRTPKKSGLTPETTKAEESYDYTTIQAPHSLSELIHSYLKASI